jgi:hypothetical protein
MQVKLVDNIPNMLNFYLVITSQELCTKAYHVLNMDLLIPGPLAPSVYYNGQPVSKQTETQAL